MSHSPRVYRINTSSIAGLVVAIALLGCNRVFAETWTSLRGTHTVDAKMVGLWGDSVILELAGGRRVSVKLTDLRSDSRIQAQQLARNLDSTRSDRISNLKGQAVDAAAPAPDPLPVPPAAPEYVPPPPNMQPAYFFEQVDSALQAGHILALYDSLPPSYRQDVNEIVKAWAQQMDPATWYGLFGTVQRLGDLVETRQKWFLSSPRVQALTSEQLAMAEGPMLTLAGLFRVGLAPDAFQLERLQAMDFRDWLAERDQAIAPYLAQLFSQLGTESLRQINIESDNNGIVTASVTIGGEQKQVIYVMVEGFWVPKSLADQWATSVQTWKQGPNSLLMTSMTAASLALQPLGPSLETLAAADSADSYHSAMESVFTPAESLITGVAMMLGKNPNRGQGANNGYGDMGDYNDMMMDGYGAEMMQMQNMDEQFRGQNYGQNYGQGLGGP